MDRRICIECGIWFEEVDGAMPDVKDLTFGVRKITYQVPGSDNLTISVNGVPVMCKGGDWGMDEAMKRIPRDRLEAQISPASRCLNLNMIRNWVGQSTSEDFYQLCDQYGIMVWDEFFQPNRSDGPDVLDVPTYLANVPEKVRRFRGHPSIVIWCGRSRKLSRPGSGRPGDSKNHVRGGYDPALSSEFSRRSRRTLGWALFMADAEIILHLRRSIQDWK